MRLKKAISNLAFDAKIRAESAIAALNYVDLMIEDFKIRKAISKADILLDVFGLLQGLFVAIDALYQLSFSATKYKYHVNVNQNRNLKHLKYLRNDIVGHPTNRNYEDGSFGFSVIIEDEITKDKLAYMTYIIKGKTIHQTKQTIFFNEVLSAYELEKTNMIKDLENYLMRIPHKTETTGLLVSLFEKGEKNQFDKKDLDQIAQVFSEENEISKYSNHRFLYRLRILNYSFNWQDNTYQAVINHANLVQILSMYKMHLDMTDKKIRIPVIAHPPLLERFKGFIKKTKGARGLIESLNDKDHPLFITDVDHLIKLCKDHELIQFLVWFRNLKESKESFIIGKLLKDILS